MSTKKPDPKSKESCIQVMNSYLDRYMDRAEALALLQPHFCHDLFLLKAPGSRIFMSHLIQDGMIDEIDTDLIQGFIRQYWNRFDQWLVQPKNKNLTHSVTETVLSHFHRYENLRKYVPDDMADFVTLEKLVPHNSYHILHDLFGSEASCYIPSPIIMPIIVDFAKKPKQPRGMVHYDEPPIIDAFNKGKELSDKRILDYELWLNEIHYLRSLPTEYEQSLTPEGLKSLHKFIEKCETVVTSRLIRSAQKKRHRQPRK